MAKLCPGQDTRFWRPEDIFEIPCGACGAEIEFFKDDVYRRCPSCGARVENPKFNLGCAQWCEHARDCLGYDPKEVDVEGEEGRTLVDRLVEVLKRELASHPDRFARALRALDFAREILKVEKAEPRVTLLAALLHDVGVAEAKAREGAGEGGEPPLVRKLLEEVGVHWSVLDRVCKLVGCEHGTDAPDAPEARVAWDADTLAGAFGGEPPPERGGLEDLLAKRLKTAGGKAIAAREVERRA